MDKRCMDTLSMRCMDTLSMRYMETLHKETQRKAMKQQLEQRLSKVRIEWLDLQLHDSLYVHYR